MELAGVADTAVVGGNRGLICIPPRAIGAVIIFEDRGTTDKSNRKTRNAVHWQDEKHMQPQELGRGSMKGRLVSFSLKVNLRGWLGNQTPFTLLFQRAPNELLYPERADMHTQIHVSKVDYSVISMKGLS